jgi:glutaredoxin
MILRIGFALAGLLAAAAAQAQQYRWVDEKGRVQYSDRPPPATAKDVRKRDFRGGAAAPAPAPFELQRVARIFPVTLYTAPNCAEPCALAREALNKRGVPFSEVQVWDEKSNEELKKVSGADEVPTIRVGRTVQKGFEQDTYDVLLDSAGYPKAGVLPPGKQTAPEPPAGYVPVSEAQKPVAEPVQPEPTAPLGPYAPGAAPPKATRK